MSTLDLIVRLRELGVKLSVADGELKVSAPKGVITANLRDELSSNKEMLLELLSVGDKGRISAATRIPQADRTQPIPMSFAQSRMWFLEEFEGGTSVYNISWAMRLQGTLDIPAVEAAINDLVIRHESLRTTFDMNDDKPIQIIIDSVNMQPLSIECSTLAATDVAAIKAQLTEWSNETFDLRTGPLLKVRLVELGKDDHMLMMVIHHIVSDAWSLEVLQREFVASYLARSKGIAAEFDPLEVQFADYSVWQQSHINEAEQARQLGYWQKQLAGAPPLLKLPTDRPRPNEQSYRGARLRRLMPTELQESLKILARDNNATLFMVLLAAFDVLLQRYSGQDDIVIGTPIAGRQRSELEPLIGLFLNTLVMRADVSDDPVFSDLLRQVQASSMDAFAHQDLPLEKLIEAIAPERNMSYTPVFQVLFMLQYAPPLKEPLAGLQISLIEFDYGTAKFDLTLATGETLEGLVAEIEYRTDLFDASTIERMLEHYEILLSEIVKNPAQQISQLQLISVAERTRLLTEWNATAIEYPAEATLMSLLDAQAAATPDAEALIFGSVSLSYEELNSRANQLAHLLINQGTFPDDLIGVCMERSVEMVVALLGIIKAGLAYVPLDPDYPQQRLARMLEDADLKFLLTLSTTQSNLPRHKVPMLVLDEARQELGKQSIENPPARATVENLAYVIFTSGSTGRPKGVMNEHRGIVNRLLWMQDEYGLTSNDRVLQKTPFSFDVSVWEFFWPLISGATLVVAKPGGHKEPAYLAELINLERITTLHFVPSMLQLFLREPAAGSCGSLKRVICSGEALSHDLQANFYNVFDQAGLHNLYGPTEAAIDVTFWACPRESTVSAVPIGRPVANTHIYIVDKTGNPTPVSVPGELWIGGIQVARGYVNQPELTAECFIADPFIESSTACVYKTGDLVRYRADGVIEFLGRIDHQVKLRGFRIELGEIETSLDALPQIEQSLVLLREDVPGDKRLVAYISGIDNLVPDIPVLRQSLQQELPEYMVPSAFVALEAFPLLPNGKIDRKALPEPDGRRNLDRAYVPPRNSIEQKLADIWSTLLRIDRAGIHDNFFELGGDSILSIQIVARAAQLGLQLTPKQLFRHQTIAELAATVGIQTSIDAQQDLVIGEIPVTAVEQWFIELDDVDGQHFNQSILLELDASLGSELIERAMQTIYRHHDALRIRLKQNQGGWSQYLTDIDALPRLAFSDLTNLKEDDQSEAIQKLANETQSSIDLTGGCLMATRYFLRPEKQPNLLLIVIHHLGIDGLGWRILLEDLETCCQQLLRDEVVRLPAKTSSFKVWASRLQDYAQSNDLEDEITYWQSVTSSAGALPLDKPDGCNKVEAARTVQIDLNERLTTQLLKDVPAVYKTRINDVLLTALSRAINRWTGSVDCWVDMEGHGREALFEGIDVSRTLGWFTSIYPVHLQLAHHRDPGTDLKAIKEQIRSIPANGIGYGLLRYTAARDELQIQKPADILFNYLGQFDHTFAESNLFGPAEVVGGLDQSPSRLRSHLLDINGSVLQGRLRLNITYSQAIHKRSTIQQFANWYEEELQSLIKHCLKPESYGRTPSDFPLCKLDQLAVDQLLGDDRNVMDIYPVTPMQQGILFHSMLESDRDAYLSQVIWKLNGIIDTEVFANAWQVIVDRHAVLRSGIAIDISDEPLQVVYKRIDVPLHYTDLSQLPESEREQKIIDFLVRDRSRRFDFENPPLIRLNLFRCGESDYQFVWTYHHIMIDGWSVPVIIGELMDVYQAFISGRKPRLDDARPFSDYVEWLSQQEHTSAEAFWRKNLATLTAPTELPAAMMSYNPALGQGDYAEKGFSLSIELTDKLQEFGRHNKLTLNTLVQGAWSILLSRYSSEEKIIFGATTSGRPAELKDVESMVGMFINTVPVAIQVSADSQVLDWLAHLQEQQLSARQYEFVSIGEIQGWSDVPRGTPLFNSLLVFENYPEVSSLWSRSNDTLAITAMHSVEWSNYPLTAAVSVGSSFQLRLDYDRQYYVDETIDQIASHFLSLLENIVNDAGCRVDALPMLDAAETKKLLVDWNDTASIYPDNRTIQSVFEAQVDNYPDESALVCGKESLSYADLNRRANRLAHLLQTRGVAPDVPVAICMDRGIDAVVAILAILKAGGAYVPLDPTYPTERLKYMLADTGAPVLLSTRDIQIEFALGDCNRIDLDDFELREFQESNPVSQACSRNLAYVMYTSGSTGHPKGVLIEHRSVLRLVQNTNYRDFSDRPSIAMLAPISFDASTYEIWAGLLNGGQCVIFPERTPDMGSLGDFFRSNRIDSMWLTATLFNNIIDLAPDILRGVPEIITGGEALSLLHIEKALTLIPDTKLINGYGPTESTTFTCTFEIPRALPGQWHSIPIGKPVANTRVYVLTKQLDPVPVNVIGELYIGGDGLSRGYLNQPEQTAVHFINDPFSSEPGCRLYKTGDLVRYQPDGNLEFVGRTDDQIKLRGFRIELGEIEASLDADDSVNQSVVMEYEDVPGDKKLIAYVSTGNPDFDVQELRLRLKTILPDYMIPAAIIALDKFPLLPNGKINRKELPTPEWQPAEDYVSPRTPTEKTLAKIWVSLLRLEQVGIHDNFFELGGDSIISMRLISRSAKAGIPLTIKKVFSHRTLADLATAADIGVGHSGDTESINENAYPPLFCVHGQPLHLAKHLHDKRSLFALNYVYEAQNLDDMPTSIGQLASVYIDEMRILQPAGPYYLFGFSAGGTVAYEIANQLISSGESIGHLCLVEPTVGYVKSIEQVGNIYADMKKSGVSKLALKIIFQIVVGVIKRRPRVWVLKVRTFFHEKTGVTMSLRLRWVNFLTRLRPAMRDYRYPVLKCNVDIMYRESDENTNKALKQFWLEKLGGECSFHTMKGAGAHLDLMEDAALKEFAELLDSAVIRKSYSPRYQRTSPLTIRGGK